MGGSGATTAMTAEDWRKFLASDQGRAMAYFGFKPSAKDVIPEPAPPPPDPTDEEVQRAKKAALQRLQSGGLPDTFLAGPIGDLTAPKTSAPKLAGT